MNYPLTKEQSCSSPPRITATFGLYLCGGKKKIKEHQDNELWKKTLGTQSTNFHPTDPELAECSRQHLRLRSREALHKQLRCRSAFTWEKGRVRAMCIFHIHIVILPRSYDHNKFKTKANWRHACCKANVCHLAYL